jgi:hypothetical protein
MNKLAKLAMDAHGGLERWNGFTTLSAHLIQGGAFWAAKGKAGVLVDQPLLSTSATRKLRTGPSVLLIERRASSRNGSRSKMRMARSLKNSFNLAPRSRDTLASGATCNSPTSPDTRCGPI